MPRRTFAATLAVDAQGRPRGTEPTANVQSLTRSLVNAAGQAIAADRSTNVASVSYATATATLGLEGTNYSRFARRAGRRPPVGARTPSAVNGPGRDTAEPSASEEERKFGKKLGSIGDFCG